MLIRRRAASGREKVAHSGTFNANPVARPRVATGIVITMPAQRPTSTAEPSISASTRCSRRVLGATVLKADLPQCAG